MSDLQCAATFLVLAAGSDVDGAELRHSRLAAVYAGPTEHAVAAQIAREAGLPVSAFEADVGSPYRPVLDALADLHRGETVAVVLPEVAVAGLAAEAGASAPGSGVLEVAVDGDGWSVRVGATSAEPEIRD